MKAVFVLVASFAIASCGQKAQRISSKPQLGIVTGVSVLIVSGHATIATLANPPALPVTASLGLRFDNGSETLQSLVISLAREVTVSYKKGNNYVDTVAQYKYGTQRVGDVVDIKTGDIIH
jgi:hypothetical protein